MRGLFYQITADNRKFYHQLAFVCFWIISFFYSWAQTLRALAYRKGWLKTRRLPCRTISVGNLCLGGTGKTPTVLWIAEALKRRGYKPAVLSRGYGGGASGDAQVVCDGEKILLSAKEAGDEPVMMARRLKTVPVIVGTDRYAAGRYALERFDVDVFILDDGYQHLPLYRDLNLLLLDSEKPFGNGRVFPAGYLREPLTALGRADAICLTRCAGPGDSLSPDANLDSATPVIKSAHRFREWIPLNAAAKSNGPEGRPAAGFCGLANPEAFRKLLTEAGARLENFRHFPDHHYYSESDLRSIQDSARAHDAECLLTTEKDAVKLDPEKFELPLYAARIDLEFLQGEELLVELIINAGRAVESAPGE